MIKNKKELLFYLECDRKARDLNKGNIKNLFNELYIYQILMRKCEYYSNVRKDLIGIIIKYILKFLYNKRSIKYGFSIPLNTFGPGLCILHRGTIVINGNSKIGKNCRINACVNIGTQMGENNASPIIGDNCFIGPGVKMFGKIKIGDNVAIGANAVVNKSFDSNLTLAGVPAKIINEYGGTKGKFKFYLDY